MPPRLRDPQRSGVDHGAGTDEASSHGSARHRSAGKFRPSVATQLTQSPWFLTRVRPNLPSTKSVTDEFRTVCQFGDFRKQYGKLRVNTTVDFWSAVDALVLAHRIVIDRAANSPHPQSSQHVYPLDYGYLEGSRSNDGEGVDVWVGTLAVPQVVGLVCTVDTPKSEVEVKFLVGCSRADIALIEDFFARLKMPCLTLVRDSGQAGVLP